MPGLGWKINCWIVIASLPLWLLRKFCYSNKSGFWLCWWEKGVEQTGGTTWKRKEWETDKRHEAELLKSSGVFGDNEETDWWGESAAMLSQVFRRKEDFLVLLYVLIRISFWCFSRCLNKDWLQSFYSFMMSSLQCFVCLTVWVLFGYLSIFRDGTRSNSSPWGLYSGVTAPQDQILLELRKKEPEEKSGNHSKIRDVIIIQQNKHYLGSLVSLMSQVENHTCACHMNSPNCRSLWIILGKLELEINFEVSFFGPRASLILEAWSLDL